MLILAMSLSGSVVFLAILLCAVLGKKVVSPAWVYNMLKLDLLFFCLPLPKYNSGYKYRLFQILGIPRQWNMTDISAENVMGIEENGRLHVNFQTYIMVIWTVWVCGLLFMLAGNLYKYQKVKALKENPRISRPNYLEIFEKAKGELNIKKRVDLLCAGDIGTVCTIGAFRKYIIVPEKGMAEEEIYYSLKHELIHAKRSDVAWRYIGLLAVLLHWFNPLAYLYFYVMSVYCEQSCDAILAQNLDKAARKRYGQLIINMAQEDGFGRWNYRTYLSGSKKVIECRLINLLESRKKKRTERTLSLLLGAVILFGGSLTVCAYENPRVVRGDADFLKAFLDAESTKMFVAEELRYSEEEVLDFVKFMGEDGICYDLSGEQNSNTERAGCAHSCVSGYIATHHKNADGSCKTDYYYADRCSKCGEMKNKGYSHTETSTRCTH